MCNLRLDVFVSKIGRSVATSLFLAAAVSPVYAASVSSGTITFNNGSGNVTVDWFLHSDSGSDSFASIWDSDGNPNNGLALDGIASSAPYCWGNATCAANAGAALMTALGSTDTLGTSGFDLFYIPYLGTTDLDFGNSLKVYFDSQPSVGTDSLSNDSTWPPGGTQGFGFRYVDFSPQVVPVPAAAWLFGSGLVGLIGMARRNRAA